VLVQGHRHDLELLGELAHAQRLHAALVGQGDGRGQDPRTPRRLEQGRTR
jgi:hypothetical protein